MAASTWRAIPCSRRQLRLDVVLQCGQSFRWRENDHGEWLGVVSGLVWRLKQNDTHVYYQVYGRGTSLPQNKVETKLIFEEDPKSHLADIQTSETWHTNPRTNPKSTSSSQELQAISNDKLLRQKKVKTETLDYPRTNPKSTSSSQELQAISNDKLLRQKKVKTETLDSSIDSKEKILSKVISGGTKMSQVKSEPQETDVHVAALLQDYFQLNVDIEVLYHQWSHADPYFRKTASDFWGIRILRQDPVENLFSFICSSNNNISRISSMVEKLCVQYGDPVAEVDGKMYYSFPLVASLAGPGVEEKLRELGFGYRAKFIATSARYIMENHEEEWVSSLRHCSYEEAKSELMKLCGVGAKVADCVCLMSLDKTGAIPVDTHVWQFAARNYLPKLQAAKSVTDKLYQEIGDHFRSLWGQYAGWAHSVLFTAELRHMQSMKSSTDKMQNSGKSQKKKRAEKTRAEEVATPPKRRKASRKK